MDSSRAAFASIYAQGHWGAGSGPGSCAQTTIEYRAFLERFLALNEIGSIVDIGCGDWQFSRYLNLEGRRYLGYDVVPELVQRNRMLHGAGNIRFAPMPVDRREIEAGDLLVIKDVLQHLPDREIAAFHDEVFPRFQRCLVVNSFRKHDTMRNIDIAPGEFRCLDLKAAPYGFRGTYIFEYFGEWERIRALLIDNT